MADDDPVAIGDEVRFLLRSQYRFGIVKQVQTRKKRARIQFGEGLRWIPIADLVVRRKLSAQKTKGSGSQSNSTSTAQAKTSRNSRSKKATASSTKSQPKKAARSKARTSKASSRSTSTKKRK